jgi:hypothetical protein
VSLATSSVDQRHPAGGQTSEWSRLRLQGAIPGAVDHGRRRSEVVTDFWRWLPSRARSSGVVSTSAPTSAPGAVEPARCPRDRNKSRRGPHLNPPCPTVARHVQFCVAN